MFSAYTDAKLPPDLAAVVNGSSGTDDYIRNTLNAYMWYGPNRELIITTSSIYPLFHVLRPGSITSAMELPYGISHTNALSEFSYTHASAAACAADGHGRVLIVGGGIIVHSRALTARQRRLYGVRDPYESIIWMRVVNEHYLLDVAGVIPRSACVVAQRHPRPTRTRRRYRDCGNESAVLSSVVQSCSYLVIARRCVRTQSRARSRRAYSVVTWAPRSRVATQWKLGADVHPSMFSVHVGP